MTKQATAIAVTPGKPESLHTIQIDVPAPGEGEVAIDVIRCGICGTDREVAAGHDGDAPEGKTEIVLGHEMIGKITSVGDGVEGFKPGDLVTATVRRPDGCPACKAGQMDMCQWHKYQEHGIHGLDGYLASQVVVHAQYVIHVPQQLEATGVLTEPLTVVEKAVRQVNLIQRRMAVWEPKTAIVTGAGPIGVLGTLLLRSKGIDVYTVARTPAPNSRAKVVEGSGAHYVSTREESLADLAKRIGNVDIILESTGAPEVAFDAMQVLGLNGVLVLLSIGDTSVTATVPVGAINHRMVTGNRVIVGSVNANLEDWKSAAKTLEKFESLWPGLTESMITTRIPIDGDLSAILHEPKNTIKTVIEFT